MILYCANCQKLFEDTQKCPDCLFSKLREPTSQDPVPLAKLDYMRAEMLGALLDDAQIPYTRTGGVASAFGMNVGMRLDVIRFFVPYGALERARECLAVLTHSGEAVAHISSEPDDSFGEESDFSDADTDDEGAPRD